jgi:hypothetical protein
MRGSLLAALQRFGDNLDLAIASLSACWCCVAALQASAICCKDKGDALFRYCQQCGKLESLELFR